MAFLTNWLLRLSLCTVVFVFLFFNNSLYWNLAPPLRAALASTTIDRLQKPSLATTHEGGSQGRKMKRTTVVKMETELLGQPGRLHR